MAGGPAPVQVGDILAGKYRVEQVLGRGGMGIVVAALHLRLDQRLALKFVLPEVLGNPEVVERFNREARAAAKLKSEHVARIIDVESLEGGLPYIVMEYLEGANLASILADAGSLPATQVADYTVQALDAIAEAHAAGIVHRDLKPSNLFVTRRADGSALVKVLDFGIAKIADADADLALTRTQAVIGSPSYMSPENMRASRLVDARSDIWSVGVILYELVSGRVPFTADAFSALVLKVALDPLPPLIAPAPLPSGFEAVVRRCLEKDPAHRFQNVAELAGALAPFAPASVWPIIERLRNVLGAPPPSAWRPPPPLDTPIAPALSPTKEEDKAATPVYATPPHTLAASGRPIQESRRAARAERSGRRAVLLIVVVAVAAMAGTLLAVLGGGQSEREDIPPPDAGTPVSPASAPTPPIVLPLPETAATSPDHAAPQPGPDAAVAGPDPAAGTESTQPTAVPAPAKEPKATSPARASSVPEDPRARRRPKRSRRSRKPVDEPDDPLATPE